MAYEATDWMCGDTVTAEKLNKLERGVQDIMSDYVPTVWECGDVITAEKLNKLEQAVADFECESGSSDFSTATVTYDTVQMFPASIACFDETMGVIPFLPQSGTYSVVLYKGKAMGRAPQEYRNIETSGGVSFDPSMGGIFTITGDGTITIS